MIGKKRKILGHCIINKTIKAKYLSGINPDINRRFTVIAENRTQKLLASIPALHFNQAIGVFQIRCGRAATQINPFSDVTGGQNSAMLFIAIALDDARFNFAAYLADSANTAGGLDAGKLI